MPIDNSQVINAVNVIKNNVQACFNKCQSKGSTFSGQKVLSNLESAIDLIPQSTGGESGTISENITGASFSGFNITMPQDDPFAEEFTIDFGSVGVTWRSIVCYSETKDGHFSIHKLPGNKCIISSAAFYNAENTEQSATGVYPSGRGTYRASYEISGNSIRFVNAEYDATGNGSHLYDEFSTLINQVSTYVNDYFVDQYKLDKITVCV